MQFLFKYVQTSDGQTTQVIRWLKAEGDFVQLNEPLLEVEVDKAEMEIESPVAGTLLEIGAEPGDEFYDGDLVAVFEVTETP